MVEILSHHLSLSKSTQELYLRFSMSLSLTACDWLRAWIRALSSSIMDQNPLTVQYDFVLDMTT